MDNDNGEIIPQHHNVFSRYLFGRPIQPVPEEREFPVQDTNPWSSFLWNWINPMLRRGFDRVIVPKDFPYVPKKDRILLRFSEFKKYLNKHEPTPDTHYVEIWALLYAIRWRLFISLACKIVVCACQIGMSLIQRRLIEQAQLITEVGGSHSKVIGYTIGTVALDTVLLMCDMGSMYLSIMNSEYARTLMMSCIHDKMLRLGPQQRHDYSPSKIMTISSSDCRRASVVFIQINALVVLPLYLGAAIGILIYMIGVSGLAGVGILLMGLVICCIASYYAASLRLLSMPYQDHRVSLTRETLKNINIIKFYGWEKPFIAIIGKLRSMETRYIRFLELLDAFNVALLLAAPNLGGALSFAVKIIISTGLPAAGAFPSLTLFQIFTPILAQVSFAMTSLSDTVVAAQRLNSFFRLPEVPSYVETFEQNSRNKQITATIEHGDFAWILNSKVEDSTSEKHPKEEVKEKTSSDVEVDSISSEKRVLSDVNLTLYKSTMNLVIGSVGTGKTSLLSTFVNAIPKTSGNVRIAAPVTISSVLSLWSQSCNVRENILFGKEFDRKHYEEIVRICDLKSDFDLFAQGDQTEVGENGVSLSGGQRARLALARCLYADGDLIILDDVLSAMDSRVGNHIYRELLRLAHNGGKTIIFSTNNLKLVNEADFVFELDGKGNVMIVKAEEPSSHEPNEAEKPAKLSPEEEEAARQKEAEFDRKHADELREEEQKENEARLIALSQPPPSQNLAAANVFNTGMIEGRLMDVNTESGIQEERDMKGGFNNLLHPESDVAASGVPLAHPAGDAEMNGQYAVTKQNASQMDEEERATGTVKIGVLVRYFRLNKPSGFALGIGMVLSVICFATAQAMSNVVLNWWTGNKFHKSEGFNLGMYTMVVSLVATFYAVFANLISFSATASATKIHNEAVSGLYRAPMAFFQKNPLGRLMMRFTQDMVNLDTQLLAFARVTFMHLFIILASVIVVFVYLPWVALCLLPMFVIAFVLMSFYRTTSREINRCMQLFDSRGMASLSEHIDGQEVIVAFDQVERSQDRLNDRLDDVISSTLHNEASNFWMAVRGGLMCEIINLVAIFLAVFQIFNLSPEQVGTVISILPEIRTSLTYFFPMYALFDNQLNSVERLDEYASNVPIEGAEIADRTNSTLADWVPTNGEIEFQSVSLRYRPNLPLVLNEFDVHMGGGKKIGICGRTGAGKSTIISALFRLVELSGGKVTIDGQDISELPLDTLRRALAIIPQSPVLFQGTIRSNLDPFVEKSDAEVSDALAKAGLSGPEFALSTDVEAEGTNFSLGQRQMIALARVILRDSKILVLDEATAAVDQGTDEDIQRTLKKVFKGYTVLCIAHRLETIMDYDEILVMGAGGIKLEMGPPKTLWENPESVFRSMCDEAGVSFQ